MKIVHVITLSDLGGAQSVVVNLANSMCHENSVYVISSKDGPMWKLLDPKIKKISIKWLRREVSLIYDFLSLLQLIYLYFSIRPDIIHLHSSKIGILGRIAFPRKKIIYTVHGFDSIRTVYRKFLPIERLLAKRAKAIVGVSLYDSRNLIKEGINNHIFTVYNGVCKLDSPFKNNFITDSKKSILVIARIAPPKDFELYISIAKLLPEYNFYWIGNSVEISNLPDNVICLGEIPNASRYYQFVDIAVLPSNYEGMPMTIIEALSFGVPVVASNVGGISEIIVNGYTGYVVENKADLFVDKIKKLLTDDELYKTVSKNSINLYCEKLTVENMIEEYYKIYKL